jgi:hypothetical protein
VATLDTVQSGFARRKWLISWAAAANSFVSKRAIMLPVHAAISFLNVNAASLTLAILILAAGSLVSSTLARISRIVGPSRLLIDRLCADTIMLRICQRRSSLAARALILYLPVVSRERVQPPDRSVHEESYSDLPSARRR